ncbi:hypothetical protein [Marinigracilibium pacificum]|uniref:Uncharacterized protein n=1 Tax=Marinigracilibium pacificum TaxID=2729599 RepID=A0A848J5H6_9BACT|nr:hypothetical protein [Marinigracilibium pacificum]NMM50498.1 hypothetical protein [Marinigracilibium pacificum]
MKKSKSRKWKKYSFEFLMIFIAVASAFALNNWNDNRRNNNAERKILTEIYNGLEKDIVDINANEDGHKSGIQSINYFRKILDNQPFPKDSLIYHYHYLTRDFVTLQNTSGYETLKSKGLELIKNDSLRADLISLYEYDYKTLEKLEENYYELQFFENYFKEINRLLSPAIKLDDNNAILEITMPINISENDRKTLLLYFWKMEVNRKFILNQYNLVKENVERIRVDIEKELNGAV